MIALAVIGGVGLAAIATLIGLIIWTEHREKLAGALDVQVKRLHLDPGDKIVLTTSAKLSPDAVAAIREQAESFFGVEACVVHSMTINVTHPPARCESTFCGMRCRHPVGHDGEHVSPGSDIEWTNTNGALRDQHEPMNPWPQASDG